MSLDAIDGRQAYHRSGRVAWLRFGPVALFTLLVAAGMAWCWSAARERGWEYWPTTGLLMALPVALAAYVAVVVGRCRNRLVAGSLGLLAAVVFQAGYFHAGLVREQGPAALQRLDLLPDYVQQRVASDSTPAIFRRLPRRGPADNWVWFAMRFALVVLVIGGLAFSRSRRAYCEECNRWMRVILLQSESGRAEATARALERGNLAAIPATVGRIGSAWPSSSFEFEYCPGLQKSGATCSAYLSLRENTKPKEFPNVLLHQGRLEPAELDALAHRLPALAWLRVSAPPAAEDLDLSGASTARPSSGAAMVERLAPDAGTNEFDSAERTCTWLSLATLAVPVAGVALLVWGWRQASRVDPPAATAWAGWVLLAAGSIATAGGVFVCRMNGDYLAHRHMSRRVRRVIATRADNQVSAAEPDAWSVNVVPRVQWHRIQPTKATDRGLLHVDTGRRRLTFEGMKERYVIPSDALVRCAVEPMIPQSNSLNFFAVVLTVRYPTAGRESLIGGLRDGCWEVPFVCRPTKFCRYSTAYRRSTAESLRAEIERLMPRRNK